MGADSYDIGLGHSDTKVRTDAESDFVLFWGMQANYHGLNRGQKHLNGIFRLPNGLLVER